MISISIIDIDMKLFRRRSSHGLLPANLTLFSCLLQLSISLSMDLVLTAREHVVRRDVANGTVQADIVVMFHVALHQPARILQRQRRSWPDALSFERFVPTFNFSVRLGIVRRSSDVGHARDPNEFLEVFGT